MTLSSTARCTASLLVVAGVMSLSAQTSTAAPEQQAQPSKGTVLFERHEAAPEGTAPQAEGAPAAQADPQPTGKQWVSSSQRRARTTLHRRSAAVASTVQPPDAEPAIPSDPAVTSSLSSADESSLQPLRLTSDDLAASRRVSDQQRSAVRILARDLDLHLNTHTGQVEARGVVTVQNGSTDPLTQVPLRISGALRWDGAGVLGQAAVPPVQQHHIADDLDHTGLATEVVVTLPVPLAAGETIRLNLYYSGSLQGSAQRLTALGAPAGRAALTDWDTVSDTFTGLRGAGDVLWYPVAGVPALLRDGNAVPAAVDASRVAEQGSAFHLRLTAEYSGTRPGVAIFCGELQPISAAGAAETDNGFAIAEWTRAPLGMHTPSLFVTSAMPQPVAAGAVDVITSDAELATALGSAAARIRPMLQEWLGAAQERPLQVLDLPVPGAAAFADGALLVAPLATVPAPALATMLVQPLTTAWLPGSIASPWLREGIPAFLETIWTERTAGREAALAGLAGSLKALAAQAGPEVDRTSSSSDAEAPVHIAGPPLATCPDPACARVRAAYVFGMLRSQLGDASLQQALSGWAVQQATQSGRSAAQETRAMEALLQQVAGKRDLGWFFANWIDEDRGLPELQIVTVAPRLVDRSRSNDRIIAPKKSMVVASPLGAEPVAPTDPRDMNDRDAAAYAAAHSNDARPGSWLVAVEVQNNGGADADVPVTVRASGLSNTLPLHVPAHGRATIRIPFEAEPEEVQVNDGSVPENIPVQHRRALRMLQR